MVTPLDRARTDLDALPGLTWTSWTADDLPAINTMLLAVEAADDPSERHSLDELQEDFESDSCNLRRDALLARDDTGEVVAVARSICSDSDRETRRAHFAGAVRPDRRGEGIGRAVMAWQLEHARAWFRTHQRPEHRELRLNVFADSKAEQEHHLTERFGLERARYFAELTLHLSDTPVETPDLPGIDIRPWNASTPEATLAVRNAAFRDHWGAVERHLPDWLELDTVASFRPQWSFVAVDAATSEVVAFLRSAAYEQDWEPQGYTSGYIDLLGTLREYRGRGIAGALISRAMHAFQEAGLDAAEIGVDAQNPTGAFGLYTGLGFRETSGSVQFVRTESAAE